MRVVFHPPLTDLIYEGQPDELNKFLRSIETGAEGFWIRVGNNKPEEDCYIFNILQVDGILFYLSTYRPRDISLFYLGYSVLLDVNRVEIIPNEDEMMLIDKYSHLLNIKAYRDTYLMFSKPSRVALLLLPPELIKKIWEFM